MYPHVTAARLWRHRRVSAGAATPLCPSQDDAEDPLPVALLWPCAKAPIPTPVITSKHRCPSLYRREAHRLEHWHCAAVRALHAMSHKGTLLVMQNDADECIAMTAESRRPQLVLLLRTCRCEGLWCSLKSHHYAAAQRCSVLRDITRDCIPDD